MHITEPHIVANIYVSIPFILLQGINVICHLLCDLKLKCLNKFNGLQVHTWCTYQVFP